MVFSSFQHCIETFRKEKGQKKKKKATDLILISLLRWTCT